ncbi:MAG TPA: hypothetical protein VM344_10885, partial [Vitreimonas sp.]|nr:hypothetical protein [Vitreimonas sp.]
AGPDVDVTGLGAAASPDVPRDDAKRLAERPREVAGGPSRLAIGLLSAGAMLGGLLLLMRARRQRRQFR